MSYRANRECGECWAICQELAKASQAISEEARRAVLDSGKSLSKVHAEWLSSMTEMFQDEYRLAEWREAQPRLVEALAKKAGHEHMTGHSVFLAFPPRT